MSPTMHEDQHAASSEDLQGASEDDLASYDEAMEEDEEEEGNGLAGGSAEELSSDEEGNAHVRQSLGSSATGAGGQPQEQRSAGHANGVGGKHAGEGPSSVEGSSSGSGSEEEEDGEEREQGGVTAIGGRPSSQASRAASKGPAVINQQNLYKRFLEARILLQKVILRSNELKLPPKQAPLPKTSASRKSLTGSASRTIVELMQVHDALVEQSQAQTSKSAEQPPESSQGGQDLEAVANQLEQGQGGPTSSGSGDSHPRSLTDDLWGAMSRRFEADSSVHEAAMERWQSRALFQQQSAVGASGKPFRAFNQRALEEKSRKTMAAGPDGEGFDDSSFYSQLLKEYLEASGGIDSAAALNASKGVKKHRNVDRRASKSRRLRFHVQEKLVNFMVPVPQEPPAFAAQLVANLFGHQ